MNLEPEPGQSDGSGQIPRLRAAPKPWFEQSSWQISGIFMSDQKVNKYSTFQNSWLIHIRTDDIYVICVYRYRYLSE